jgi:exopolyphosphatase/guanosine-5'-triphosphate,3'-diphosphate pyrophosphatase
VFGAVLGAVEAALAALTPARVEESDELYLLSAAGGNVKVRDGLMDIKVLREVSGDGLERWEPVMKSRFPLAADEVSRVFEALDVAPPPLTRSTYTLDQLLADLVEPSGAVRTVHVHKRRVRYELGGCMAEITEVEAEGRTQRTAAIESEDPSAVIAVVRSVGLDGHVNTSYPQGLAALIHAGPARYAVIDVGTNSVKFHVGERDPGGSWQTIADRAEVTRLGENLEQAGVISAEPLERTVAAIAGMVEEASRHRVLATAAVGTAGLRTARNRKDVIAAIRARTGLRVEVISGEEESRLAYLAVRAGLGAPEGSLVVFDTGGGSSQFSFGRGSQVEESFSVDVGAVRYTERFGLAGVVDPGVLEDALAAISADLARIEWPPPAGCSGGDGWSGDQHHGRDARPGHLRPRRCPRCSPGAGGDRSPDRVVPVTRRRGPPRDRRPAAQARGGHPRRRLHRPDSHGQAGTAEVDGERSGSPPWIADRPVWHLIPWQVIAALIRWRAGGYQAATTTSSGLSISWRPPRPGGRSVLVWPRPTTRASSLP